MLNQNHTRVYKIPPPFFFLILSTFVSISVLPLKIWDLSEEVLQWCLASRVPPLQQSILLVFLFFFLGNALTRRAISPGCCHCRSHTQARAAGVDNAGGRSHQAAPPDSRGDRFLEVIRFVRFLLSRCKSTNPWLHLESSDASSPSPSPCLASPAIASLILITLHIPSLFFLINESPFLTLWN